MQYIQFLVGVVVFNLVFMYIHKSLGFESATLICLSMILSWRVVINSKLKSNQNDRK